MSMQMTRLDAFGGTDLLDSRVARFRFAPHWHDEYVFAAYVGGQKNLRCGRMDAVTQAGDVLIIAPGTIHSASVRGEAGWHYRAIYLDEQQLCGALGHDPADLRRRIRDHVLLGNMPDLAARMAPALDAGDAAPLALAEWVVAVLARLPDHRQPADQLSPHHLRRVHQRIMDSPAEPLQMNDLTALADVTAEHLSRAFKASYGLSPFQLLTAARLDLAHRAIRQGRSLAAAAMDAGFSDQSHMTRWFRRAYGVTPGQIPRHQ